VALSPGLLTLGRRQPFAVDPAAAAPSPSQSRRLSRRGGHGSVRAVACSLLQAQMGRPSRPSADRQRPAIGRTPDHRRVHDPLQESQVAAKRPQPSQSRQSQQSQAGPRPVPCQPLVRPWTALQRPAQWKPPSPTFAVFPQPPPTRVWIASRKRHHSRSLLCCVASTPFARPFCGPTPL